MKFISCGTHLLHDWTDIFQFERREFILLQEIIKILFKHLKDEASVIFMLEALVSTNEVEFVGVFCRETV